MLTISPAPAVQFVLRLLAAAAAALLIGSVAAPAHADDDSAITWSVRPADSAGADGRSWAELELDPGESHVEHLALRNLGQETVTFALSAADGYFTTTGRFNMLSADQTSVAAGTWISVDDSVTVPAGETVIVPYTVTVPDLIEPGDHAAGIAASILSVQSGDGTRVGVESRVGFRVMTRVSGEVSPAVTTTDVSTQYALSWNPFTPGALDVAFEVENTGNVRLDVSGEVKVGDQVAPFPVADQPALELLPGDRHTMSTRIEGLWPIGLLFVDLVLEPAVVATDKANQASIEPATSQVVAWAIPWPQLIVVLGLGLIVVAFAIGRARSRRRLSGMVAIARAEGERVGRLAAQATLVGERETE